MMNEKKTSAGPLKKLQRFGIAVPRVMLPREGADLSKFAVIACDQHSAEPAYWEEVVRTVGDAPSALHLMLPEAWLSQKEELEPKIVESMNRYVSDGTLCDIGEGLIYIRRQVGVKEDGSPLYRHGLLAAIDLDRYEYQVGNHALIRATEATVKERLPERIEIRQKAPIELPHVLVLLNDQQNALTALLEEMRQKADVSPLYSFDLMMDGGHIEGYQINEADQLDAIASVFEMLYNQAEDGFLMAVGDGNHSLAAAKEAWKAHPDNPLMRYALVELVSVYDEGLSFHPIHRLLMHLDPADIPSIKETLGLNEASVDLQALQPRMDEWLEKYREKCPEAELEYIHGRQECLMLGEKPGNLAIVFDRFERGSFFETVLKNGIFVRKSFSLGEAREKRYYLESRKIR